MTQAAAADRVEQATYRWLLAWIVMGVLLSILNKTRAGHTVIYYGLALLLLFLVATQYRFISSVFGPIGQGTPRPLEPGV